MLRHPWHLILRESVCLFYFLIFEYRLFSDVLYFTPSQNGLYVQKKEEASHLTPNLTRYSLSYAINVTVATEVCVAKTR